MDAVQPKFDDDAWDDARWRALLEQLVNDEFVSWKDITALTLGHLNPPQVGTSLASSDGFKQRYEKGKTLRVVLQWFYEQSGRCADCQTRLELQADHIKPREEFADKLEADFVENLVLRCRRCNVIRRPSHRLGGRTHLTAEAALMWILLTVRPRTLADYTRMCRLYGMTMADIRMQEAWAMAVWLNKADPASYEIDSDDRPCSLLLWHEDQAITRCWVDDPEQSAATTVYDSRMPSDHLVVLVHNGSAVVCHRYSISAIPFSHYFVGTAIPAQSLAVVYTQPKTGSDRAAVDPKPLSPRATRLLAHATAPASQPVRAIVTCNSRRRDRLLDPGQRRVTVISKCTATKIDGSLEVM